MERLQAAFPERHGDVGIAESCNNLLNEPRIQKWRVARSDEADFGRRRLQTVVHSTNRSLERQLIPYQFNRLWRQFLIRSGGDDDFSEFIF